MYLTSIALRKYSRFCISDIFGNPLSVNRPFERCHSAVHFLLYSAGAGTPTTITARFPRRAALTPAQAMPMTYVVDSTPSACTPQDYEGLSGRMPKINRFIVNSWVMSLRSGQRLIPRPGIHDTLGFPSTDFGFD